MCIRDSCTGSAAHAYSWGRGREGQLGHGLGSDEIAPRLIAKMHGRAAAAVACGARHSLFLAAGYAFACGEGRCGELGLGDSRSHTSPRRISAVPHTGAPALLALAAGARHSLLLDGVGGVHACGGGASGQLGTCLLYTSPSPRDS